MHVSFNGLAGVCSTRGGGGGGQRAVAQAQGARNVTAVRVPSSCENRSTSVFIRDNLGRPHVSLALVCAADIDCSQCSHWAWHCKRKVKDQYSSVKECSLRPRGV